jgi:hypothetical protein
MIGGLWKVLEIFVKNDPLAVHQIYAAAKKLQEKGLKGLALLKG